MNVQVEITDFSYIVLMFSGNFSLFHRFIIFFKHKTLNHQTKQKTVDEVMQLMTNRKTTVSMSE